MNVLYIGRAAVVALALGVLHAHAQRATDAERVERADPLAEHKRAQSVYDRAMALVEAGRTLDAIPILTQLASGNQYEDAAKHALGDIYSTGKGVPQDEPLARLWYSRIRSSIPTETQLWLAESYCRGAPLTTADTLIRDPRQGLKVLALQPIYTDYQVREYYIRYLCLSRMEPRDARAWEPLSRAIALRNVQNLEPRNQRDLEMLVFPEQFNNKYPLHDRSSAITAHEKQAIAGDVKSQLALVDAYSDGRGAPQDRTKAFEWAMKAAEAGDSFAQTLVGEHYLEGYIPVVANASLALNWLTHAAGEGRHPIAAWLIHQAFRSGKGGIKVDRQLAAQYLSRCVELQGRMCKGGARRDDSDLQKAFDK